MSRNHHRVRQIALSILLGSGLLGIAPGFISAQQTGLNAPCDGQIAVVDSGAECGCVGGQCDGQCHGHHACGQGLGHGRGKGHCHGRIFCPSCHAPTDYCQLTWEEDKEKRACFQVENKTICIPRIHFPWEKCLTPKCGRTKVIRVLKVHEYECPVCSYSWEIKACEVICQPPLEEPVPLAQPIETNNPSPGDELLRFNNQSSLNQSLDRAIQTHGKASYFRGADQ